MDNGLSGKPKALKDILMKIARNQGWEDKLQQVDIPPAWKEAVDDKIYKITKILNFSHGTLYIHTDSPTWRYELNLREQSIREDLNRKLGKQIVNKIIFK